MDEFLARRWWVVWAITGLLVVLPGPNGTSAPAAAAYVAAVAVFPFGARAVSLHHERPRTRWREAVVTYTTARWTRWLLAAAYTVAAAGYAWRFAWRWLPPVAALVGAAAITVATRPLPWVRQPG